MDVVLRHQRDRHAVPPCRGRKAQQAGAAFILSLYEPKMMILHKSSETFTCSCRSSDSVDVDLGESGGVVVDYHLDCRNIQTSEAAQH